MYSQSQYNQNSWHETHNNDNGSERQTKRQKVKLACRECRDRKIRCDGGRPMCESCIRKNLSSDCCLYSQPENSLENSSVTVLQERVQELESTLRSFTAQPLNPTSSGVNFSLERHESSDSLCQNNAVRSQRDTFVGTATSSPINLPSAETLVRVGGRTPRTEPLRFTSISRARSSKMVEPHGDDFTVAQENYGDSESGSDDSPALLGSSSALGFMTEVIQTFQPNEHVQNQETRDFASPDGMHRSPRSGFGHSRKGDFSMSLMQPDIVIPPRDTADSLLDSYWLAAHPLLPIIYRQSFMKRYNRIWKSNLHSTPESIQEKFDGTIQSDQIFHCKLNLVFALGCRYRSLLTQQQDSMLDKMQKKFIKRATGLLSLDIMDASSVQLVQALLLMTQYLHTKPLSDRCWVVLGMAIRVAQSIALHVDIAGESQAQREERRRTWSSCILLDRVQSMTFGRQLMLINPLLDPLPQMVDDEFWSTIPGVADGSQPKEIPSKSAYFVYVVKLSTITAEILRLLYSPDSRPSRSNVHVNNFDSLLKLDSDLSNWQKSLPTQIRFHHSTDTFNIDDLFLRQSHLLHHRFLNTRILLFRQLLVQVAAGYFAEGSLTNLTSLQHTLVLSCVGICISAAQELLDVIQPNIGTLLVPPAWFTIFSIYISGTVLAVVFLTAPLYATFTAEQKDGLAHSWNKCIECLRQYEELGLLSASKCLRILKKMHTSIETSDRISDNASVPDLQPHMSPRSADDVHIQNAITRALPSAWSSQNHLQVNNQFHSMGNEGDFLNGPVPESWWLNDDIEWLIDLQGLNP